MALLDRDDLWKVPMISVQVCWNCEYLQVETGKYFSKGPYCAECGDTLDTYQILK